MPRATPDKVSEYDDARIIERPDGFYCQDKNTNEEFGPFPTFQDAVANINNLAGSGSELDADEDLKEVEEELGIADWIDPDTGAPAEESIPHIEEH